ncbi:MAG: hypothetical protein JWM11_3657 [Planctomycetaceae bacterium]|nr:hypothetical protein [Planctomycetaceae bacterium]
MRRCLSWTRIVVLVPLIAVFTSVLEIRAADAIPSERRLGNDVIGFFSIRNITELKSSWDKTQLGQLLKDKEIAPFLKQFEGKWGELETKFETIVGLPLNDVLAVPQGEFSIAVVHTAGKQMGAVAFLDFGDKRESIDKLIEKLPKAFEAADLQPKKTEEDVDGTQIIFYEMTPADDADDDEKTKKKPKSTNGVAYFIKDSLLVVGSRVDIVKSVLTRWDGQHERIFADKQAYKYLKEKCRGENSEVAPQMVWYLDPIGLFKGGMAMANLGPTETAVALGFLPSLGLDKIKGIGGSLDMGTDEYDMVTRTLIYVEAPPSGVLNAFQFPKKNLAPPKWVSADASTYGAVNWDVAEAYNTVETLYETFLGAGSFGKIVDDLAEQEGGPKIHIKKDIIDHLTGTVAIVGHVPEQAELIGGERYLICLELKDEAPMKKVLEKLADLEGFPFKVREFQGEKIFEMPAPDGDEKSPFHLGFAITKKHLVFATHVAELESMLRPDKDRDALVDSEVYKILAKRFPDQTSSLAFQRSDAQLKLLYDALKSGALTEAIEQDDFKIDTSTLPEFEVLKKYFKPSGGYMIPDEKGWFMISFSLKSDGNK